MKTSKRYFPAEWYPQGFVQLTWPHEKTDWAECLDEAEECFLKIASEIIKKENLLIVAEGLERVKKITSKLNQDRIIYLQADSNDTWARDHGGITVIKNKMPVILNYKFNGWGLKFPADFDNQITKKIFESRLFQGSVPEHHHDFVLEGGSIESDGAGTVLTNTQCLLSKNRNEHMSKKDIENRLKKDLGAERVIFLNHGFLKGDDTDSHIDTLVRFCKQDTVCYVKSDDEKDCHYDELKKMEEELKDLRQSNGEKYCLVPLPMCPPIYFEGERLPATYANFLIIDGAVLVPVYNVNTDEEALGILRNVFVDREIVPIDCSVLIRQHGSLHCVTMQYPKEVLTWLKN